MFIEVLSLAYHSPITIAFPASSADIGTSRQSPGERITARSIRFWSSRLLPGHE